MLQIRAIVTLLTIVTFSYLVHPAAALAQSSGMHTTPGARKQLELTQVDVFATRNWNSEDIRVLDFHLGMSRADALENARKRNLNLIASTRGDSAPCSVSECVVCDQQNILCDGIELHFGNDDHVEGIDIMRPLQEAPQDLRRASVTQQFKGQTYLFFHSYSNAVRLKLFGPESGHEGADPSTRTTKYVYPRLGMEVYVSVSAHKRVLESKADLTVYFVYPKKSGPQASKVSP